MKKARFCYSQVFLTIISAIVLVLALTTGCRLIPGADYGSENTSGPSATSISGKVLKSSVPASMRPGVKPKLTAADLAGFVAVPGAEVWIEDLADDLRYHTTSDASGSYVINNVPPGVHRVVTRFFSDDDQVTMKCRSAELKVANTPEVVEVPDMPLEAARNIVTGQLRDTEGNFLPENTVLTLWGETFKIGKDGFFTSPPLPDSYSEAEILVQLPGGNGVPSFGAPFISDVVPAFMDLTVGASPETGNNAPSATLKAYSGTELVSKTTPGNILTLVAVGADADSGDQAALTATWDKTAGTFANGASDFEKHWTAPEFAGMATISVEVKDPRGATGRAFLPILVGIDNPSQADSSRPTVTLSTETAQSTDSEPFVVRITFNEPVTGFAIEDVTVTNGSLSDLTTLTASKVYTVKVTPLAAGEVKVTVSENIANDAAGNKNTAGNAITVTNSITPPAKSSEKALVAFSFLSPAVDGSINVANKTIALMVPYTTDVSALKATFTISAKAALKVGSAAQISGTTVNDFTSPVTYTVVAEDGSEQNYVVTVTKGEPVQITAAAVIITAPVLGAVPQTAAAVEAATGNVDYTVSALNWNEALTAGSKFKAGQVYTATVTLTSKNSKKFQAVAFTPTVAGSASVGTTTTTGAAIGNTVTFTVTYTVTGALAVSSIAVTTQPTKLSYAEATDGTLALNGMVVTETNNDGSTSTVTFTAGTAAGYTASPANGATLINATHNGQPVVITHTASSKTGSAGNLTVSAIVEISAAAVTITAPMLGADPQAAAAVETATSNADYTVSALTWNEALTAGGKFKAGQVYTATVTLTSKNSKKFQAAAFTPTVAGSASVGNTTTTGAAIGNTVTFTVTYAATGALAINSISVTTQPTRLSYAEAIDVVLALNGMVVTETNNDGSTNIVTFTTGTATGYTTSPANGADLTNAVNNGNPVVVTHTASSKTANTSSLTVMRDYTSANLGTLKFVPAGTFQRDATSVNTSTVSAFRMSQYEITRAQFKAIMVTDPSNGTFSSGTSDPVQMTNWYHAIAYCNKLSMFEGLTPAYTISGSTDPAVWGAVPTSSNAAWDAAICNWSANGYRLPTEMEWMWAAMGATSDRSNEYSGTGTNPTGYTKGYAGSIEVAGAQANIGSYAWYNGNSSTKTHPAGTKNVNELGLYDMSGNVQEWCWDWYAAYPANNRSDYHNDASAPHRVFRGGGFTYSAGSMTVAYREGASPSSRYYFVGFRVVRP